MKIGKVINILAVTAGVTFAVVSFLYGAAMLYLGAIAP